MHRSVKKFRMNFEGIDSKLGECRVVEEGENKHLLQSRRYKLLAQPNPPEIVRPRQVLHDREAEWPRCVKIRHRDRLSYVFSARNPRGRM